MKSKQEIFIDEISKELLKKFRINSILVYGSYVSKKSKKGSDLDIIIFSEYTNISKNIKKISEIVINKFLKENNGGLLLPSLNIWSNKDIKVTLPYYLVCLSNKSLRIVYDDGSFKEEIERCRDFLKSGKFMEKELEDGRTFWVDLSKEKTLVLADFFYRKYTLTKKYATHAFKKKDYVSCIELCYKGAFYLIYSVFENLGIHIKEKTDAYFINKNLFEKKKREKIFLILNSYFILNAYKKSIHPFLRNSSKDSAKTCMSLLKKIEMEKRSLNP